MIDVPSTILVTGAAGLIGSALVRLLGARGCSIVACDDFSLGRSRVEDPNVVWETVDVADEALADRLGRHPIDLVVHCAAHPGGRSLDQPVDNVRVNALGSMRLFEWCARAKIPIVYLSSSAVYGEQPPVPISEEATLRPGTVYAVCKVACEGFLRVLEAGRGLQWTTVRLFATYGAGHRPSASQGIVNVILTQLMAGNRVVLRGSLDRVRDLVYVDDAARAVVECALNPSTRGRVINIGTGSAITVRELIDALCDALGRPVGTLDVIEADPTPGDPHYSVADTARLKELTGFAANYSLEAGLARFVRDRLAA